MKIFAVCSLLLATALVARAQDNYADTVVSYTPGTGINTSFENSSAALGAPAPAATITAPAFGNTEIVGVGNGGELTVEFNTPITNDPANHAGGMDFTIFGNEFFILSGGTISGIFNHTGLTVWVRQDNVTYYQLSTPQGADDYFPTQGSGNAALPVSASLTPSSFTGQTSAQALTLYNGSAGGASYSISSAVDSSGSSVDLSSISYVKVEGTSGFGYVDAISRVETIPEPSGVALLFMGLGILLFYRWHGAVRKRRNQENKMKTTAVCGVLLAAFALVAHAQTLTVTDPNYAVLPYYTDPQSNNIVSFDWTGSGNLVYMTADAASNTYFTGLYGVSGGINTTLVNGNGSVYSGASVVTIGNNVYFNNSDNNGTYIYQYGPTNGTPSVTLASSAPNFSLTGHNGQIFITAGDSNGINDIYYSNLGAGGSITNVIDLGVTSGYSGPLAFNAAGDLFYAPGYGDQSIYKWTAAQVAAAMANPTLTPLSIATATLFASYSSDYGSESGASSMLVDKNGNLLVTLTSFGPGVLVNFGTNGASPDTILADSNALGDLNQQSGTVYLAADNQIVQVIPEPSTVWLLILGIGVTLAVLHVRRAKARS